MAPFCLDQLLAYIISYLFFTCSIFFSIMTVGEALSLWRRGKKEEEGGK